MFTLKEQAKNTYYLKRLCLTVLFSEVCSYSELQKKFCYYILFLLTVFMLQKLRLFIQELNGFCYQLYNSSQSYC